MENFDSPIRCIRATHKTDGTFNWLWKALNSHVLGMGTVIVTKAIAATI